MNVSSEVSYLALTAACVYTLYSCNKNVVFFLIAAGFTLLYAVLGALREAHIISDNNLKSNVEKYHETCTTLVPLITLPALSTAVWLKHSVIKDDRFSLVHLASGIGTALVFTLQNTDQRAMDLLVGMECLSVIGSGFFNSNSYAIGAGVLFAVAYYLAYHYSGELPIPKYDLYQYILAAFILCAFRATNSACPWWSFR